MLFFGVFFVVLISCQDSEPTEIDIDKEFKCTPDFVIPGPDETVEFRFPNTSHVTRETIVDKDNYVILKVFDIHLPKGIGLYFRTAPYNASNPRFVANKYLDSGVNMLLINQTEVFYDDEDKLFLNYRYESILNDEAKCRSYDVWVRFSMNEMIKYGHSGASKEGMFMELIFYWGYFIRNLNQKSEEEPIFLHSETALNALLGMKRKDDMRKGKDEDDIYSSNWDDDDDDDDYDEAELEELLASGEL